MFLVNWFYGMLNWLGLAGKSAKILFLGLDNAGGPEAASFARSGMRGGAIRRAAAIACVLFCVPLDSRPPA